MNQTEKSPETLEKSRKKKRGCISRIIVVGGVLFLLLALLVLFGDDDSYLSMTQEEAAKVMAEDPDCQVVDVRTRAEYEVGHIPGAICVPLDDIEQGLVDDLPDKEQLLLLYCYAGRRSKLAAEKLASLGYTRAYEFGGIVDWTGEVVTD